MIKRYEPNRDGRDFVVGDLHGCYTKFMEQLSELDFNFETDRIFCCGDLIDRGLESFDCLMLMYEPWFYSVRGNHEQMMIDYLVHGDKQQGEMWIYNGGTWALDNLGELKLWAEEADYLLPYQIQIGNVGIIHADVGNTWRDLTEEECFIALWDRTRINNRGRYNEFVEGIGKLYVGHTPTEDKLVLGNVHYMDSGAVFTKGFLRIEEIVYV